MGQELGPVVVTGGAGLLGGCVARVFSANGAAVHAFTHAELDITDREAVARTLAGVRPSLVVHCAAMTNVDACEEDPDRAFAVNAEGSANVARAAADVDATIVAISTDYVFDGASAPYREDDTAEPIQVYGRSKLEGEERVRSSTDRHYIVRSAWIYGRGGKNFLSKLPDLAASQASITAVVDQRGSPTYAPDLAEAIARLVTTKAFGTYHVVNQGACTFAEFCEAAVELLSSPLRVEHVKLADLGRPAPRPKDTSLESAAWQRAGFEPLRPWRDAARAFLRGDEGLI